MAARQMDLLASLTLPGVGIWWLTVEQGTALLSTPLQG